MFVSAIRRIAIASLWIALPPVSSHAQQQPLPTKAIDLAAGCAYTCLMDATTGRQYLSGTSSLGPQVSDFNISTSGYVLPSSSGVISIFPPSNALGGGFTVAMQLAPSMSPVENVFSLMDNSNRLLFSLLRDKNGRWYVGKERDNPTASLLYYTSKTWDPVSPCVIQACVRDTIYASFQTNGQIQLDEVAVVASQGAGMPADSYNWQSGLLNFGYPLTGFNVGGLTADPTAPLQQWPFGGITLQSLQAAVFSSPAILSQSVYPQAQFTRLAVWSTTATGQSGVLNNGNHGIVLDQASVNANLLVLPQTNWINCSSGSFEQPKFDIASSTQYWPAELPTPCNVPSAPLDLAAVPTAGGAVTLNWTAPAFLGATNPGVTPSIQNYEVTSYVGGALTPLGCSTTGTSCVVSGLSDGQYYAFEVAAKGMGGATTSSPVVNGLSPAAVYAYSAVPTAPGPPTNLAAASAAGSLTMSWTAPTYTGGSLSSYKVLWSPATGPGSLTTAGTSATIPNLVPDTTYTVAVQGINNVGAGVATVNTFSTAALDAPGLVNANGGLNSAQLSWSAPDNVGSATASYVISYKPVWSSTYAETTTNSLSATLTGLQSDTEYTVLISAAVNGYISRPATTSFLTLPSSPTGVHADTGTTTANLTWVPPVPVNGQPILSYEVTVTDPGNQNHVYFSEEPAFTLQSLAGSATYQVGIQAINSNGGGPSAVYSFTMLPGTPPTVNQNGATESFVGCGDEGSTCQLPDYGKPTLVAYGATYGGADHYVFAIEPTLAFVCNAAHFFTTPAQPGSGIINGCYVQSGSDNLNLVFPPLQGSSFCAVEDTSSSGYSSGSPSSCNLPASGIVAFGVGTSWTYKNFSGPSNFSCAVSTFGADPAPGQTKQCFYYFLNDPTGIGMQYCAPQNGSCQVSTPPGGHNLVSYGVNYRFQYGIVDGWFWCNNNLLSAPDAYGGDPDFGSAKGCFYRDASAVPSLSGATYCASDNLGNHPACLLPANSNRHPIIYYGTPSAYRSLVLPTGSQAINCDATAFAAYFPDPAPGLPKTCWYAYQ